jgi:NhaA family Na+:H+ antiporter
MTRSPSRLRRTLFPLSSRAESARIGEILRKETVGGLLLVVGAALALLWANSPWAEGYFALRDVEFGGFMKSAIPVGSRARRRGFWRFPC